MELSRSMWYYQSRKDDSEVMDKLAELAEKLPTRGFDEYYGRIRQQGYVWNRKRVLRIYRLMKLGLRRKHKRRLPTRVKHPLISPETYLDTWSMDFMSDALVDGRKIRVFNVIDDFNREALAIEAGIGFPSDRVIRVLSDLTLEHGKPKRVRVDNGPEFTSIKFQAWCKDQNIEIRFIQPGSPTQNAYIERFNRYFREDVLDAYWFEDLNQLRIITEKWRDDYNENHPHKSLGRLTPNQFKSNRINKEKQIKKLNLDMS